MSRTTTKRIFKSSFISNSQTNDWLKDHAVIVENNLISDILHNNKLPKDIDQTHEVINLGKVFQTRKNVLTQQSLPDMRKLHKTLNG